MLKTLLSDFIQRRDDLFGVEDPLNQFYNQVG
jgi:hypothetical protein